MEDMSICKQDTYFKADIFNYRNAVLTEMY
jgi:hypothetical protein